MTSILQGKISPDTLLPWLEKTHPDLLHLDNPGLLCLGQGLPLIHESSDMVKSLDRQPDWFPVSQQVDLWRLLLAHGANPWQMAPALLGTPPLILWGRLLRRLQKLACNEHWDRHEACLPLVDVLVDHLPVHPPTVEQRLALWDGVMMTGQGQVARRLIDVLSVDGVIVEDWKVDSLRMEARNNWVEDGFDEALFCIRSRQESDLLQALPGARPAGSSVRL